MSILHSSDLRRIFSTIDLDRNGHVDVHELSRLLDRVGISIGPDELESIVGRTSLDLQDFIYFYESISTQQNGNSNGDDEADLIKAFKVFDQNDDGFITSSELQNVLARLGMWDDDTCGGDCTRMIGEFDVDSDGRLDFNEFKMMMSMRFFERLD